MSNMTRRNFIGGSAAAAGIALLAGCSSSDGAADEGSAAATTEAADDLGLVEEGKLTCIANMYFPPFESMDEETGEPVGFDIDLGAELAAHMGLEVNWLPSMQFDTLVPTIATGGTADCTITGMTITDERLEEIAFTEPYLDSNQAVVIKAGSGETSETLNEEGKQIAVQAGTTGADWAEENLPNATVVPLDEIISAMTGLSTGSYDGLVIDLPVARYQITNSFSDLEVVEEIPTGEQYGVGVSKDNPALLEALDAALVEMDEDGSMAELQTKWFGQEL